MIDLNAAQAAIRAGYSKKAAKEIGYDLLTKVHIQSYLSDKQKERSERTQITKDKVLQEYAKLAFLQPSKFFDENDRLLPVNKLDEDVAAALAGFEVIDTMLGDESIQTTKKIKFSDKKGALDSLAKHLGMFNDKQNGSDVSTNIVINFTDA